MRPTKYAKSLGFAKKQRGARRVVAQAYLLRHALKGKTESGLSMEGERQARAVGRLLRKPNASFSSGTVIRTKTTAERIASGSKAGKPSILKSPEFSSDKYFHDEAGYMKLVDAKRGNEDLVIRDWLDGKVSASIVDKPKEVSDPIIKRLSKNFSEARALGKNPSINITHSGLVEAVFERLTGKKFDSFGARTMVRVTEGLRFDLLKSGKIILRYRGKHFDVTNRFNEIASQK